MDVQDLASQYPLEGGEQYPHATYAPSPHMLLWCRIIVQPLPMPGTERTAQPPRSILLLHRRL